MRPFEFQQAKSPAEAIAALKSGAAAIGGGTNLVDLMKLHVQNPARVVDVNPLPWREIADVPGGLRIGALVSNSALANDARVKARFPMLSEALLAGASPQLRNMATVGGNLMQRTRCLYFRDLSQACNKRAPGSGCGALDGYNRMHAVLGTSERCIAAHPSDMCVALAALGATIELEGPGGKREVPATDFHLMPGDHPERETVLNPGELIVAVRLEDAPFAARSRYVKVRDRASFAFALASAAVGLELDGGKVRQARIALGGVGTKPWRAHAAELALVGQPADEVHFKAAAQKALEGARPRAGNAFKVELAKRTVLRALQLAAQE